MLYISCYKITAANTIGITPERLIQISRFTVSRSVLYMVEIEA